jgi:hypothetical protein
VRAPRQARRDLTGAAVYGTTTGAIVTGVCTV